MVLASGGVGWPSDMHASPGRSPGVSPRRRRSFWRPPFWRPPFRRTTLWSRPGRAEAGMGRPEAIFSSRTRLSSWLGLPSRVGLSTRILAPLLSPVLLQARVLGRRPVLGLRRLWLSSRRRPGSGGRCGDCLPGLHNICGWTLLSGAATRYRTWSLGKARRHGLLRSVAPAGTGP